MATFTYTPDFPIREESKPRVRRTELGDGYEQRIRFGLNTDLKTWPLTFSNREVSELENIRSFLQARGGYEAFDWTPPVFGAAVGRFVCEEWDSTLENCRLGSITATFRQVAEPS